MKVYFYNDEEDGRLKELFKIIVFEGEFYCSNTEAYKEVEVKMFQNIHHATYGGESITRVDIECNGRHNGALIDLFDMKQILPKESAYSIARCYGGPEEGGWWYDEWVYLGEAKDIPKDDDNGTPLGYSNSNGHIRHVEELFIGDHETKSTPHYC